MVHGHKMKVRSWGWCSFPICPRELAKIRALALSLCIHWHFQLSTGFPFFLFNFLFLLCVPYWQLEQQKSARSDQGFNQFHQGFTASSSVRWIPSSVELSWPFHYPKCDYFGLLPLWQPRKVYIILTFHNFSKCGLERGPRCARATHLCAFFGAKGSLLVWRETLGVKIYFWCEGTLFGVRQYSFGVRGCIQWEGITFGVRE